MLAQKESTAIEPAVQKEAAIGSSRSSAPEVRVRWLTDCPVGASFLFKREAPLGQVVQENKIREQATAYYNAYYNSSFREMGLYNNLVVWVSQRDIPFL